MSTRVRSSIDNRRNADSGRKAVCLDTINRTSAISAETPGASLDSTFIKICDLPTLSPSDTSFPNLTRTPVRIINGDTFTVTRQLMQNNLDADGSIAVLNLASDQLPAGGWYYRPSMTQEEALCYASTLFATLKPEYYNHTWTNMGPGSASGIFSPAVTIFRDKEFNNLPPTERKVVSVISVAAPRFIREEDAFRKSTDLPDLRQKIRLIYRMAARNGKTFLVLGAMGCGAYNCPAPVVAREMKAVLEDTEFDGWFQEVVFALFVPPGRPGKSLDNFTAFKKVFETEE